MNNLIKLSSLHALRSLRRTQTPTATLGSITTGSSILLRNHSLPSLGGVRHFGGSGNSESRNHEIAPPSNWGIQIVPERMAFVIERLGKYHTTLRSGIHFLIPIVDRIAFVHSLKDEVFNVPGQIAVTLDNVEIQVDGDITLKIEDPHLASYGAAHPFDAAIQVAQGTMRSAVGKLTLDDAFKERENLNDEIVRVVNEAVTAYGLKCIRYVLKSITPPLAVRQSMEMQADAERQKRVKILVSEGERDAAINQAEGELAKSDAFSRGISFISKSLKENRGDKAASLLVAQQYVKAFGNIAKQGTTILLPSDSNGVSSMISQALTLYKRLCLDPENESTEGFKAVRSSEQSQQATKLIDDKVDEVKVSKKVTDEPGFSLQNRS